MLIAWLAHLGEIGEIDTLQDSKITIQVAVVSTLLWSFHTDILPSKILLSNSPSMLLPVLTFDLR